MKKICKCGERISEETQAEADRLGAEYPRCVVCLQMWKESVLNKKPKGGKGVPKSKITEDLLVQFASEGLSRKDAADKLGMTFNSFANAFFDKKRPWIKEAWKRGESLRLNGGKTESVGGFGDEKLSSKTAAIAEPAAVSGFRTNDALTHFFYFLLRDYMPAGRVHKILTEVRDGDGKTKVLSNFYLASLAEEYAGIIRKTK